MNKRATFHIAIIGVDGCRKSFCYQGLLDALAQKDKVAGIGDKVLVSVSPGELAVPEDILRVKFKSRLAILVKMYKNKLLYEISKVTELVSRSKIHGTIVERYKPKYIVTDGSPLINI